jgi:hypothetical protein
LLLLEFFLCLDFWESDYQCHCEPLFHLYLIGNLCTLLGSFFGLGNFHVIFFKTCFLVPFLLFLLHLSPSLIPILLRVGSCSPCQCWGLKPCSLHMLGKWLPLSSLSSSRNWGALNSYSVLKFFFIPFSFCSSNWVILSECLQVYLFFPHLS